MRALYPDGALTGAARKSDWSRQEEEEGEANGLCAEARDARPRAGRGSSRPNRRVRPGAAGETDADVHQGHCANLSAIVPGVPPAGFDCADIAADVSGRPALGAIDSKQGGRPGDAALVYRPVCWHQEIQERSIDD